MALIDIRDLTFAYPGSYDNVFEHLSLQLDTHWRLGLVGRNGRGKTTLLRLLQRQYEYDGAISEVLPKSWTKVMRQSHFEFCIGQDLTHSIFL